MGSRQSQPIQPTTIDNKEPMGGSSPSNDAKESRSSSKSAKAKGYTGFKLVEYQCRKKKKAYSKCHAQWYSSGFLSGKDITRDENCDDLFEEYRLCVLRGMKREREKKGLPPAREGSMLAELDDEEDDE